VSEWVGVTIDHSRRTHARMGQQLKKCVGEDRLASTICARLPKPTDTSAHHTAIRRHKGVARLWLGVWGQARRAL